MIPSVNLIAASIVLALALYSTQDRTRVEAVFEVSPLERTRWAVDWSIDSRTGAPTLKLSNGVFSIEGWRDGEGWVQRESRTVFVDIRPVEIIAVYAGWGDFAPEDEVRDIVGMGQHFLMPFPEHLWKHGRTPDDRRVLIETREAGIGLVGFAGELRRQKVLELMSVLSAVHYQYVIRYQLFDDGTVSFGVGATGRVRSADSNGYLQQNQAHAHCAYWRVVPSSAAQHTNQLPAQMYMGRGSRRYGLHLLPSAQEGPLGSSELRGKPWSLFVGSSHEQRIRHGVDVIGFRDASGIARDSRLPFLAHQAYLTKFVDDELDPAKLELYYSDYADLMGQDVAVWFGIPVLHVPRQEDLGSYDPLRGAASTMWMTGTLKPRSLFSHSPTFPQREGR